MFRKKNQLAHRKDVGVKPPDTHGNEAATASRQTRVLKIDVAVICLTMSSPLRLLRGAGAVAGASSSDDEEEDPMSSSLTARPVAGAGAGAGVDAVVDAEAGDAKRLLSLDDVRLAAFFAWSWSFWFPLAAASRATSRPETMTASIQRASAQKEGSRLPLRENTDGVGAPTPSVFSSRFSVAKRDSTGRPHVRLLRRQTQTPTRRHHHHCHRHPCECCQHGRENLGTEMWPGSP